MSIFKNTIKECILTSSNKIMKVDIDNTEFIFFKTQLKYIKLNRVDSEIWRLEIAFADQKLEVFVQEWQREDKYDPDAEVWGSINNFKEALAEDEDIVIDLVMSLKHHGYHHELRTLTDFQRERRNPEE